MLKKKFMKNENLTSHHYFSAFSMHFLYDLCHQIAQILTFPCHFQ